MEGGSHENKNMQSQPPKRSRFVYFRLNAACWLILFHELLERFSFYGMKGLVTLFLIDFLHFDRDIATSIYHLFTAICYLLPVAGAVISDNFLGRFKTVIVFGIVYLVGHALMPLTTLKRNQVGPLVGMFILSIGTGIIKPCVAAFGGDQTPEDDEEATDAFFSLFYLCINIGAFISQMLTPILKERVDCVDGQCYPLAFGVPAAAFFLTYILFIAGKPLYRFRPGEENVFFRSLKLIFHSIGRRMRLRKIGDKREHFLDYGDDEYERKFINDVKIVLSVLFLYLPFPIFWALFDQQGSRWSVQASQMDGRMSDKMVIYPEQMQMINPLLMVILIPLFNNVIYPLLTKCRVLTRPPSRMVAGYLFATVSFLCAGAVQFRVDDSLIAPQLPALQSSVRFVNLGPCDLWVTTGGQRARSIPAGDLRNSEWILKAPGNRSVRFSSKCRGRTVVGSTKVSLAGGSKYTIGVGASVSGANPFRVSSVVQDRVVNRKGGKLRFIASPYLPRSGTIELVKKNELTGLVVLDLSSSSRIPEGPYKKVPYGPRRIVYRDMNRSVELDSLEVTTGLIGTIAVLSLNASSKTRTLVFEEVPSRLLKMYWQLPQYVLMTMGEVLFSVTAMAFAYSESPPSMKAIAQSVYLVTIFFGNILVMIVAALPSLPSLAWEFILFAILVLIAAIIQGTVVWMFYKSKAKRLHQLEMETKRYSAPDDENHCSDIPATEVSNTRL